MEKNQFWQIAFGMCKLCLRNLNYEEYYLGLGRCRGCSRKCEEELGFTTIYGNIEVKKEKKFTFIDNSRW